MQSIQKKLRENKELTEKEKEVFNTTSIPLGHLILLMTHKGSGADLILERYSSSIAFERVFSFMHEALQDILGKAQSLRAAQANSFALDTYIEQVENVLKDLTRMKLDNDRKQLSEERSTDLMLLSEKTLREKGK